MTAIEPLVLLLSVQAKAPSLQDNTADLDRLVRCIILGLGGRRPVIPFSRLAKVAGRFRKAGFKGFAVINSLDQYELVDFLAVAPPVLPAMALDLGTTYLEASLIDLMSGRQLARGSHENSQIEHGADILSRMHFAARNGGNSGQGGEEGLGLLHRQIIAGINDLAEELAKLAGVAVREIRALAVSGNTTMTHFFLNLSPYHICREPYIPMVNRPDPARAADLGLGIHPAATVWVMPNVSSYFGGDLISGILATGLDQQDKTCMLIDVGTNAEVVLGNRDWLMACAGAAGPALEGGVARMGMRAGSGAIEHVQLDPQTGDLKYTTIGNSPARGLCGSGLIDLAAALYLTRVIDMRGKFRTPGDHPFQQRQINNPHGAAFLVADTEETGGGPITLTQQDLDGLLRSKAAMYAILTTLVNQVGLSFTDIHRIYVAGAFGQHIAPRQAITLGMLPDLPLAVYEPVGNSSLAGAEAILTSGRARQRCLEIAKKITYLELNVNQEFMGRFSGARFIPHTDRGLFPSVPFFGDR